MLPGRPTDQNRDVCTLIAWVHISHLPTKTKTTPAGVLLTFVVRMRIPNFTHALFQAHDLLKYSYYAYLFSSR